jgi:hypothetical protein
MMCAARNALTMLLEFAQKLGLDLQGQKWTDSCRVPVLKFINS